MKRAKFGAEKVRDFRCFFSPHFHINPKRRKVPEKSGVFRPGREPVCGKERSSHALKADKAGQSK